MNTKKTILFSSIAVIIIAIVIFLIKSAAPFSKEAYLEDYKEFIDEVSDENDTYSEDKWKDIDEKFDKFNEEWYEKFEDELSFTEKLTVAKYNAEYKIYKYVP